MNKNRKTVTVTIDNKVYRVARDLTILQAAEQNNIFIPTLCSHKDLSPHGGCRLCVVEVEGIRNFPTACTTPVEDKMIIRTHTAQVQAIRSEILQLFMSEHPSSCLICDEKNECNEYSVTIQKAGVTTGCRYCPNNNQCEMQEVVEKLEIKEINYPIYYRNLRVEKEDPFYDRDYNLCILCGRCIRMCQEVRLANVLAFKNRGRHTVIGPAYDRTHLGSGCEFCGSCVSVCPTGTLYEKARKWDGKPDREQTTTCSFCGVGCQLTLLVKEDRVIGSLPVDDPVVNKGQLCVKGRFCITELVSGYKRLTKAYKSVNGTNVELEWNDAINIAAEKLINCTSNDFGMIISPNCSNEDLYIAQKFARVALGSHQVDCSARFFYGRSFNSYIKLFERIVPLSDIRKSTNILCIGLDTRFGRSVVSVEIRKALKDGAKIITINPQEHNLSLTAEEWLRVKPGKEIEVLDRLLELVSGREKLSSGLNKQSELFNQLLKIAQILINGSTIILIGSEFIHHYDSSNILEKIYLLSKIIGAGILPLPSHNNLLGSVLMGVYPELLPGGLSSKNQNNINKINTEWKVNLPFNATLWNGSAPPSGKKMKVLYLIGENIDGNGKLPADFLIYQNIYPPNGNFFPNLVLPAAAFTEIDGSFINGEGRIQRVNKAVDLPGQTLPDWSIICKIAQKMGIKGFEFNNAAEIHKEISKFIPEFQDFNNPTRQLKPLKCKANFNIYKTKISKNNSSDQKYPFFLNTSVNEHIHRGIYLAEIIKGAERLFYDRKLEINPNDALKAKIRNGDEVIVTSPHFKKTWPALISPAIEQGTLHVTLPHSELSEINPHRVKIRKKHV